MTERNTVPFIQTSLQMKLFFFFTSWRHEKCPAPSLHALFNLSRTLIQLRFRVKKDQTRTFSFSRLVKMRKCKLDGGEIMEAHVLTDIVSPKITQGALAREKHADGEFSYIYIYIKSQLVFPLKHNPVKNKGRPVSLHQREHKRQNIALP